MKLKNIPNYLSISRIFLVASLYILAFYQLNTVVLVVLIIALLTDLFDGLIARWLNASTEKGAKLDSIADYATFLSLPIIIYLLKPDVLTPHLLVVGTLMALYVFEFFTSYMFQGKFVSLHLYSSKISANLISVFVIYLLVWDFNKIFFSIIYFLVVFATLEDLTIQISYKKIRTNGVSFFYGLKDTALKRIVSAATLDGFLIAIVLYIYRVWITESMFILLDFTKYALFGLFTGLVVGLIFRRIWNIKK